MGTDGAHNKKKRIHHDMSSYVAASVTRRWYTTHRDHSLTVLGITTSFLSTLQVPHDRGMRVTAVGR